MTYGKVLLLPPSFFGYRRPTLDGNHRLLICKVTRMDRAHSMADKKSTIALGIFVKVEINYIFELSTAIHPHRFLSRLLLANPDYIRYWTE